MIEPNKLDELVTRLSRLAPPGMRDAREDLEKNFRAVLNAWLERMELVTREEFEIQTQVLHRTREKLAALEARLAELEDG